jgi:hemerythrin
MPSASDSADLIAAIICPLGACRIRNETQSQSTIRNWNILYPPFPARAERQVRTEAIMTAFMAWSDSFSVGVAKFDEEHKQLIGQINEMHDSVRAGVTSEVLGRISDALIAHTLAHFEHEERYFDELRYPRAGVHRAMHEHLKKRLVALRREVGRKDSALLAEEMLAFLRESLPHHIQGEDKKLGAYLNEKGVV